MDTIKKFIDLDWFKIIVGIGAIAIPAAGGYLALRINFAVSQAKVKVEKELTEKMTRYVDDAVTTKAPWTKNEKYVLDSIEQVKQDVRDNGTTMDQISDRVGKVERTVDKVDNKVDLLLKKSDS